MGSFFYSTNYNFIRYTWFNRSVRIANISPSESSNNAYTAYMVLYLKMRGISIHTESEIGKHRVAVTWQLNACQCWKMFFFIIHMKIIHQYDPDEWKCIEWDYAPSTTHPSKHVKLIKFYLNHIFAICIYFSTFRHVVSEHHHRFFCYVVNWRNCFRNFLIYFAIIKEFINRRKRTKYQLLHR